MSIYNNLDRVNMSGLNPVETYQGVKIFLLSENDHDQINAGYAVVSRKHLVDEQLNDIEGARSCIDHFLGEGQQFNKPESAMRYFIFFYKCRNRNSTQYIQAGHIGTKLPSSKSMQHEVSNDSYSYGDCNMLSFNEVSEEDFNSFFDRESNHDN